jgi:hypothetical protein
MTDTNTSPAQISLQDIQNILVLIDLVTQRGAFRGPELASVGALYEKLNKFVQETQTENKED